MAQLSGTYALYTYAKGDCLYKGKFRLKPKRNIEILDCDNLRIRVMYVIALRAEDRLA